MDVSASLADSGRWLGSSVTGSPPEGRWRHSATTVENAIYIFGGLVDDRKRFNDMYKLNVQGLTWEKVTTNGQQPAPRAHHSATFVKEANGIVIFGGYGGAGKVLGECQVLDMESLGWRVLETKGTPPKPRYDHTASLLGEKLVVFGGRDLTQSIEEVSVLDVTTMAWEVLKVENPETPIPCYTHAAVAVQSAISWKLFTFTGRSDSFEYIKTAYCMDTRNMLWMAPKQDSTEEGCSLPSGREHCAVSYDPKSRRLLFFGGWRNRWLDDIVSLDVGPVVGPQYAATGVAPIMGPLSGGRQLVVQGRNFVNGKVDVKFNRDGDEEIVSGKYLSETEVSCTTPNLEAFGAGHVDVKVAISGEMFTVNKLKYFFYNDTKAANCIAYGPGLTDGMYELRQLQRLWDDDRCFKSNGTELFQGRIRIEH